LIQRLTLAPAPVARAAEYLTHESDLDIDPVLRVFHLKGLGISPDAFLRRLSPSFDQLPPDHSAPGRRRAIARFRCVLPPAWPGEPWEASVERTPTGVFRQPNMPDRVFEEADPEAAESAELQRLLQSMLQVVREAHPGNEELPAEVFFHQIRTTATRAHPFTLPDGAAERDADGMVASIHQDGADYILSALTLRRDNVLGGESRVYLPARAPHGKRTRILQRMLQPFEGILQDDRALEHGVTPITAAPGVVEASRDIIGFDIKLS
jgi:hypothetical protein